MRTVAIVCLGVALTGCGGSTQHPLIAPDGSPAGNMEDLFRPGEREKAREAADDAKCREFGFKPGTDGYANCRLQLDTARSTANAVAAAADQAQSNAQSQLQPLPSLGNQGALSFMCKDALARGDKGAAFISC